MLLFCRMPIQLISEGYLASVLSRLYGVDVHLSSYSMLLSYQNTIADIRVTF